MSRFNAPHNGGTLAVLHEAGGSSRLLIASTAGPTPSILEAVEFPAGSAGGLAARLQAHKVDRIIGVVPASGIVCRTCSLPQAEPEQLQEVLELQAEGQFVGHTPDHRIAMSVLPTAPGETNRSGIVLSWPESATRVAPSLDGAPDGCRRSFCPDIAGLAALLNGVRPPDPLIWLDRAGGSVALAITHTNGAIFRCTQEEVGAADHWEERLGQALAETAMSVGHSGAFVQSLVNDFRDAASSIDEGRAALLVPEEILTSAAGRFDGAPSDPAWWSTYGIAAGVVLASAGEMAPLTMLQDAPHIEKPSRWRSIVETISRPRAALVTGVICLGVLGLAPPAMSGLRLGVLRFRHPDVHEQAAAVDRAREQLAMYDALEREAWSMTKLLADIASNTPEGIDLASMRLQHSDSTFAVSGLARPHEGESARDVVAHMQQNLSDSRLFREIRLNWGKGNRFKQYEFELSAKIVSPHRAPDYAIALDYEKWPLAARERGDGPPEDDTAEIVAVSTSDGGGGGEPADDRGERPGDRTGDGSVPPDAIGQRTPDGSPDGTPDGTSDGSPGGERAGGTGARRPRTGVGGGAAGGAADRSNVDERTGATGPGLDAVPEPMSKEQIEAMTKPEVLNRLTVISTARERAKRAKDEELEERLQAEFDALFARLRELK